MARRHQRLWKSVIVATVVMIGGLSLLSCSSNRPADPTPQQQIKGESDRFFDKLKQEERERARAAEKPAP
jgi:ABC-type transporter MlaC component